MISYLSVKGHQHNLLFSQIVSLTTSSLVLLVSQFNFFSKHSFLCHFPSLPHTCGALVFVHNRKQCLSTKTQQICNDNVYLIISTIFIVIISTLIPKIMLHCYTENQPHNLFIMGLHSV